ncbi:hypothetical protein WJX84_009027 [Apatococcus fuscideae]|uniref:Uncharacterized protein n=1 Tax=Apatococcus fuscideae TaxID=2026836 RepID=A0AAW1S158_9CHLO
MGLVRDWLRDTQGGALAGALLVKKLTHRQPPPEAKKDGLFASSSEALESLTTAAEELFPASRPHAQVIDRSGAKVLLVLLVLAALVTLTSLWVGAVRTKTAVISLTCIAATLWGLLLSGHLLSSTPTVVKQDNNVHTLAGCWIKDKAASSSMDAALDIAEINGLVRKAIHLLKGCEISLENGHFTFAVTSIVPWFKITERYPLTGEPRQWRRRDLRRGKHTGYAEQIGNTMCLHLDWGAPHGGHGRDRLSCPTKDELVVESDIVVGTQTAAYRTIYRRA